MSAVIKTATPFIIESVLLEALDALEAEPQLVTNELSGALSQRNQVLPGDILTNRSDYNGRQIFRKLGDRWVLMHDGDEYAGRVVSALTDRRYAPVNQFLTTLGSAYERSYQKHLEEVAEQERVRLEQERQERIEATRQLTIKKAKEQGYTVKENLNSSGQIQLVLTRTV